MNDTNLFCMLIYINTYINILYLKNEDILQKNNTHTHIHIHIFCFLCLSLSLSTLQDLRVKRQRIQKRELRDEFDCPSVLL